MPHISSSVTASEAAGGIRTYADAMSMIKAGANRIGTSTVVAMIEGGS